MWSKREINLLAREITVRRTRWSCLTTWQRRRQWLLVPTVLYLLCEIKFQKFCAKWFSKRKYQFYASWLRRLIRKLESSGVVFGANSVTLTWGRKSLCLIKRRHELEIFKNFNYSRLHCPIFIWWLFPTGSVPTRPSAWSEQWDNGNQCVVTVRQLPFFRH